MIAAGRGTNPALVGADHFAYEWLPRVPHVGDVPARDITLAGRNDEDRNGLGTVAETVRCGAYVPFRTETRPGQTIQGSTKCTGAVLRCEPDGSELEVVAWGHFEIAPETGGVRMQLPRSGTSARGPDPPPCSSEKATPRPGIALVSRTGVLGGR